jgi:hypothetical protein
LLSIPFLKTRDIIDVIQKIKIIDKNFNVSGFVKIILPCDPASRSPSISNENKNNNEA